MQLICLITIKILLRQVDISGMQIPSNAPRAWWTECFDLEKEKIFLKELGSHDPLVIELNAKNRYTKNVTK